MTNVENTCGYVDNPSYQKDLRFVDRFTLDSFQEHEPGDFGKVCDADLLGAASPIFRSPGLSADHHTRRSHDSPTHPAGGITQWF